MDLGMPEVDGVTATRQILEMSPHIAVLVLTMTEAHDAVFDALRAGARGYLLKGADRAEIMRAIEAVAAGEAIFGPDVARRLMHHFSSPAASPATPFPELSQREQEILELVARGMANQAIADRLGISPKTVRNHVSNIFGKLQVRDRAEAVVRARDAGLGGDASQRT
jgi:DNA-binding NarL/FixJ family response regulator